MIICSLVTTEQERDEAFCVRKEVFVKEQGISEALVFDANDDIALHVIARDNGCVVGTARILLLTERQAKVERMAVLSVSRRYGIGKKILQFMENELRRREIRQITLHAQYNTAVFYEACGFRESGKPFLEAGIKHILMKKELGC